MVFYTYLYLRYDGTPYYVGKGSGIRAFTNSGRNFAKKPLDEDRIIIQEFDSEQDAFEAEKFLISFYGRKDTNAGCLLNMTDGGDGCSGHVHSEESKKLMSEIVKRRPISEEQSTRIRKIQLMTYGNRKGCKQSPAQRKAFDRTGFAPWNKGKSCSDELKEKFRQAKLGKPWSAKRREAHARRREADAIVS